MKERECSQCQLQLTLPHHGTSSGIALPHIEGDGHHGVEDNDVSPEVEEAPVGRAAVLRIVEVPGGVANLLLPVGVSDGQPSREQDKDHDDLQGTEKSLTLQKHLLDLNPKSSRSKQNTTGICRRNGANISHKGIFQISCSIQAQQARKKSKLIYYTHRKKQPNFAFTILLKSEF